MHQQNITNDIQDAHNLKEKRQRKGKKGPATVIDSLQQQPNKPPPKTKPELRQCSPKVTPPRREAMLKHRRRPI
jgi:hypothetical protein